MDKDIQQKIHTHRIKLEFDTKSVNTEKCRNFVQDKIS